MADFLKGIVLGTTNIIKNSPHLQLLRQGLQGTVAGSFIEEEIQRLDAFTDTLLGEGQRPSTIVNQEDRHTGNVSLDFLYGKIFPIGLDDNNRYINLSGQEINTVQLIEPKVSVRPLIYKKESIINDNNNISLKYAYRIPVVEIENYSIPQVDICAFRLDYREFIPTVTVEFMDSANQLLSTNIPKDGSIIKVFIGGNGDELYYKPIRQDFVLTSIKKVGTNSIKYRVTGKLNIPYGYRRDCWSGGENTVMQTLFNLAAISGLGFATNFTNHSDMPDKMNWTNTEGTSYFEFMQTVANHACYSPNTFFTSFIDQYNVLNFVECHSLLSHGGQKTDTPAFIYRSFPPAEIPEQNPLLPKTPENQLPLDGADPTDNKYQRLSYYYLTNDEFFDGWSNYIEDYHELNNSGSSLSEGFMTNIKYNDSNDGGWGFNECDFLIRPIDNLIRDNDQHIKSIPTEVSQDSYIPLNLMQMTNEAYITGTDGDVDNMTNIQKLTNFGEVDTSNVFKLYYFAEVQNKYQMKCLKKCGLKVKLQNYNPSVTKFSRVWVDIYDRHPISNSEISKNTTNNPELKDTAYMEYKTQKNDNIIQFADEGTIENIYPRKYTQKWPKVVFNRSLSGWYVVTEIEIFYDPNDNNLKMNLMLNRIEYKPTFKTDYEKAQRAIDKYKEENVPETMLIREFTFGERYEQNLNSRRNTTQ